MKKILMFATAALLTTGATYASKGKKCGKSCSKKKTEKTTKSVTIITDKVKELKA
jgi:hypothetical protein